MQGPRRFQLRYRVFDDKFDNITTLVIYVTDVNDNPPRFDRHVYNVSSIWEEETGISDNSRKHIITVSRCDVAHM